MKEQDNLTQESSSFQSFIEEMKRIDEEQPKLRKDGTPCCGGKSPQCQCKPKEDETII